MDDGKIKYEDLISPDDSIKVLIEQLTELNKTYGTVMEVVKSGAKDIVGQLKSMSTATHEGRAEIDEATAAANRLARAQKELKFAMSDTGKEVAWLKSQVASQNKMSSELQKASSALAGSYDKLKLELREQISLWKSLEDSERRGTFGQDLLNDIMATKQRLSDLDGQLKVHVQSLSAVEKAEQKLAFLRSKEGKRLMELKQLIADEIAANRTKKETIDEVARASERYMKASSETNVQVQVLNQQTREANRIAKLQAQLITSAEGSYNKLAAQYELNKIKLNAMSAAERQGTEAGKQLEAETLALYVQMQKLQEATGNHRLSVGNYARSWDGLGISVSQVVRELPAAAVSLNTFFLGISNNIPMVIDEIIKLREENKKAVAEGKPAKSIVGSITKALFGWNTILVILLAVFSKWGKQIIDWIGSLGKAKNATISTQEALDNINKELKKTNNSYGQNIITVKKLAREWSNLSTKKEQLQWIKDNKTEFDKLDASVRNIADAENIFVNQTKAMVNALKARAKAAAAMKLAADKYEEALIKEAEAEAEAAKEPSNWDTGRAGVSRISTGGLAPGDVATRSQDIANNAKELHKQRVQALKDLSKAANETADQYYNMAQAIIATSDAELKAAGIEKSHKYGKDKHGRTRTQRQRDLTDQIWRNDLSIRKKYELSISALQRDEFKRRRIEAIDATNQTIREMQEKFRKNQDFLTNPGGKYKALTPEQRAQIEEQQKEINAIIENSRRKLEIDLQAIEDEKQIDKLQKLRHTEEQRVDIIAKSLEEEKKLRLQQIEKQESLYITSARSSSGDEVVITGSMTPEQKADFKARREKVIAEYDLKIYNLRKNQLDDWISYVRKGSEQELNILLEQLEIERQIALAENKLKSPGERREESDINREYNLKKTKARGNWRMTNFDQWQAAADAEFNIVKRSEQEITKFKKNQELARWKEQIRLAKSGAIEWSDAQEKEARAMVKKLEREISELDSFMNLVSDKGLGGALLTKLGFDDDQIAAMSEAVNIVLDNIKSIADAEVEAAERAVEAAEKRVEAAQSAYDAEVEGRNNGYANSVATAKKELQQEKKNQMQKQKLLEEAQRRQEAINSVIQASSLVTASANLWSSFSSIPIVGPTLAIAAIAAMWASFAVAKVKAAQVTKAASQEYGEGGFEILEGGSHASGDDIDLHTKNSKGKNMRAEGGEAMAIINRRSTRRYRRMLPQIVDSINKGTFEEKFSQAFKTGDELSQSIVYQNQMADLSQLEEDVRALKRNSEQQYYAMPDGSYIEKRKNVLRRVR